MYDKLSKGPARKCESHSQTILPVFFPEPRKHKERKRGKDRCIICRGNLLRNGSFDYWDSPCNPLNWRGSGVKLSKLSHTGIGAAGLGLASWDCDDKTGAYVSGPAFLFQDIKVCPHQTVELKLYLAQFIDKQMVEEGCCLELGNPTLVIKLVWFDKYECELGSGIDLVIPAKSLGVGWFFYQRISSPAPSQAVTARLSLSKAQGNPVLVDDVSLVPQGDC